MTDSGAAMTDATDVALEKACEAFWKTWPGFREWCKSNGIELYAVPPEPFEAAIEAYQAALPKGELAERLLAKVAFVEEAARYFEKRPTGGEDMAHWSNVFNAKNCRDISDLLRAAASLLGGGVPEGWQPIETAPKDGTCVLGCWPGFNGQAHVGEMHWQHKWWPLATKEYAGWWAVNSGPTAREPTHWQPMPLPARPPESGRE